MYAAVFGIGAIGRARMPPGFGNLWIPAFAGMTGKYGGCHGVSADVDPPLRLAVLIDAGHIRDSRISNAATSFHTPDLDLS